MEKGREALAVASEVAELGIQQHGLYLGQACQRAVKPAGEKSVMRLEKKAGKGEIIGIAFEDAVYVHGHVSALQGFGEVSEAFEAECGLPDLRLKTDLLNELAP